MYIGKGVHCSNSTSSIFNFGQHVAKCLILNARSTRLGHSNSSPSSAEDGYVAMLLPFGAVYADSDVAGFVDDVEL